MFLLFKYKQKLTDQIKSTTYAYTSNNKPYKSGITKTSPSIQQTHHRIYTISVETLQTHISHISS